ncbi:MAG: GAF domain-containing protein, partial [Chloroflexales bacterium]|nr:GAF domain-containing protein [Chloroflexales bacterium]
ALAALALRELGAVLGASRCLLCAPAVNSERIPTHEWAASGQATMLGQPLPAPPATIHSPLDPWPFAASDFASVVQLSSQEGALATLFEVRALVTANLIHSGHNIGTLEVHSSVASRCWLPHELALVQHAADYMAIASHQHALTTNHAHQHALQRAIDVIATTCATILDQEAALTFILEQLAAFVRYDSASVWLLRDDMYGTIAASRGFDRSIAGTILYLGPGSINWRATERRAPVRVGDSSQAEGWMHTPGHEQIISWMCVPLILDDAVVGQLTIDSHVLNGFSDDDERIAQAFANQVAASVQRVRLYTEARRRAEQLQLLHQASAQIGALRDADAVASAVGHLLHEAFGYYQVMLALVEDGVLRFSGLRGHINDVAEMGVEHSAYELSRYPEGRGITGWAVVHGRPMLANDVLSHERYHFIEALASSRAALAVPILSGGSALGAIYVESDQTGAFDQHDQELLETLAGQVAMALDHIRSLDTERRLNVDLRAAYARLQRAQDELVRTEQLRVLGELASGVAHDFNNMLAGILGHAQLLLDVTDSEVRVGLSIIERAALDGAATVRRLQEFAHIRESVREPVDLSQIVEESLAVTRPRWRDALQEQGVAIEVVHEAQPLPLVIGDGAALRDMITNLILNALDAMPQGGTLRLSSMPASGMGDAADDASFVALLAPAHSGPAVRLEVGDSGVGMELALLRRIFDPFFTTKGKRGTGLGLAIAQGIVQRHGGGIVVRSRPGSGSTFVVHLPAVAPLADSPIAA